MCVAVPEDATISISCLEKNKKKAGGASRKLNNTMHHEHFIALDTETGGLDSTECALLSIAAVPSWDAPSFQVLIMPEGRVEARAAEVNGYTPELWKKAGAVSLKVALLELRRWVFQYSRASGYDLAAHNAGFDALFLLAAQARTGIELELPGIWHCTQIQLKALREDGVLPPGSNHLDDLGALSGFWEISPRAARHDALQDAECVRHGLRWIREKRKEAPRHG
jgi:DNA polymerase III epsilon subunit-like protein